MRLSPGLVDPQIQIFSCQNYPEISRIHSLRFFKMSIHQINTDSSPLASASTLINENGNSNMKTTTTTGEIFDSTLITNITPAISSIDRSSQSTTTNDLYNHDPWSPKLVTNGSIISHNSLSDIFGPQSILDLNINQSALPIIYHQAFNATDPSNGTASLANVHRVLASSGVGASVIEQILSARSGRPHRVSKSEFCIALAAVAFLQQGKSPINVQRVITRKASLPTPTLDLGPLTINPIKPPKSSLPDDPWCPSPNPTNTFKSKPTQATTASNNLSLFADESDSSRLISSDSRTMHQIEADSQFSTSRFLPKFNPHQRDSVSIRLSTPEGWILKYNVYAVDYEKKGTSVPRRFSDFDWLHACLLKRYPFRLIPSLPPKRIAISGHHLATGDEAQFLEKRRRGLQRFLTFLVNHPVISTDSILNTFLTEPSDLATWRSHSTIHLIEESIMSRLTPAEEISIPEDLDDRLTNFRSRLPLIIEHWTRICNGLERVVRRSEAQSADFVRIQFAMGSAVESAKAGLGFNQAADSPVNEARRADEETELVGHYIGKHAEIVEQRCGLLGLSINEQIRAHKELFTNFLSLFNRFDRLSGDDVDKKLKPRAEINTKKLEEVRLTQKLDWEEESDRLKNLIEEDRARIESKLKRRVFIRWCLWQEMVHVIRVSSLIGLTWKEFGDQERRFSERTLKNWGEMGEMIESFFLSSSGLLHWFERSLHPQNVFI
ncbi:hypothetical protein O181_006090 [Austropuccinia psidii MF-1]|uniref:Sorting nexin MVP1 n=1 Tax=Austropuccinia psidii MF-1 TaxID=1389203 RepID=A0A9Q3GGH5_9BASI|nr:hypothetical protein [Austropuccinia psidii MF-1]